MLGHSRGGFVVALYGARHPGHAGGLILAGTMARFDLGRLTEGIRRNGGDEVAELARREYAGDGVSAAEWVRVYAAFGPHVPDADALARRVGNPALYPRSMALMRGLDIVGELGRIDRPTLVIVGERDGIMPVECSQEIVAGLRPGVGRLEVIPGAGRLPLAGQRVVLGPGRGVRRRRGGDAGLVEAAVGLERQELGEVVAEDEAVEQGGRLGHAARLAPPSRSSSSSRMRA